MLLNLSYILYILQPLTIILSSADGNLWEFIFLHIRFIYICDCPQTRRVHHLLLAIFELHFLNGILTSIAFNNNLHTHIWCTIQTIYYSQCAVSHLSNQSQVNNTLAPFNSASPHCDNCIYLVCFIFSINKYIYTYMISPKHMFKLDLHRILRESAQTKISNLNIGILWHRTFVVSRNSLCLHIMF